MTEHIDPIEAARSNLLAAVQTLQQCTKTAANVIPLADTNNVIMVGSPEWIAKNVPGVEAPPEPQGALTPEDYVRLWCANNLPAAVNWAYRDQVFDFARAIEREVITRLAATTQASAAQSEELKQLRNRVSQLEAARIGYASEFPLSADGEPDVGSVHANIRALKAKLAATSSTDAQAAAEVRDAWISVDERLPEGTCIASYQPHRRGHKPRIIRAVYFKQYQIEASGDDGESTEYNEADDTDYIKAGWYERIDNWGDFASVAVCEGVVTHWMPLPAAPSALRAGDTGGA